MDPYRSTSPDVSSPTDAVARARKSGGVVKWLVILAIVVGGGVIVLLGTCVYIGATGPDTKAIPGRQIPARFVSQIRNLKLLEPGEQIQYFYSDALFNIEEGFYLLTDRKVVIYSRNLDDPSVLIPFSDIADLQFDASDNWVDDSQITLELTDGSYASFPVSAQGGGDQNMYAALKKRWEAQRSP